VDHLATTEANNGHRLLLMSVLIHPLSVLQKLSYYTKLSLSAKNVLWKMVKKYKWMIKNHFQSRFVHLPICTRTAVHSPL
jgi:hypothetical protein